MVIWWLPNFRYVFAYNFYKQHLLHVKFHRRNEKNRGFQQWMNPKVIGSNTFKGILGSVEYSGEGSLENIGGGIKKKSTDEKMYYLP